MSYQYLLYIGKPPKVENALGQANFVKEIVSNVPLCPGDLIVLDKIYLVEVVIHSKGKPAVMLLEATITYQFNPVPWLVDENTPTTPLKVIS